MIKKRAEISKLENAKRINLYIKFLFLTISLFNLIKKIEKYRQRQRVKKWQRENDRLSREN